MEIEPSLDLGLNLPHPITTLLGSGTTRNRLLTEARRVTSPQGKLAILPMCPGQVHPLILKTLEQAPGVSTLDQALKQALGIEQELEVDLQQAFTTDMPTSLPVLKADQTAAQLHNHIIVDVNERHPLAPAHHLCRQDRDIARNTNSEDSTLQAPLSLIQM